MIDTDGVLDKCAECGARARFVMVTFGWAVECSECVNCTNIVFYKDKAMTDWNKTQRLTTSEGVNNG